jgi:hypothetical protein
MDANHAVVMLLSVRGTWNIEVAAYGKQCVFGCSHDMITFISRKTGDYLRNVQIRLPLHVLNC